MAGEDKKAVVREFLDHLWNIRDISVVDRLIASHHISHGPMIELLPRGRRGVRAFSSAFFNAFPDIQATIERQELEGDLVKTWVTFRGTHTGQYLEIPATNKQITLQMVLMDCVVDGQIVESWAEWKPLALLQQLGKNLTIMRSSR